MATRKPTTYDFPQTPMATSVLERAYAGYDASGAPRPTTDYMNPMWARWFDEVKNATGGDYTFGAKSDLQNLPDSATSSIADDPFSSWNLNPAVRSNKDAQNIARATSRLPQVAQDVVHTLAPSDAMRALRGLQGLVR